MKMLPALVVSMVVAVSMLACGGEAPAAPASTVGPLLTVEWRGGLCQYGGCSTTLEVATDGAYRLVEGSGVERSGSVDSTLFEALVAAVATADFDAVRVHGSTETCPTAYDGQELIYTFHMPAGDERMSTCEDVIEFDRAPFPQAFALIESVRR